MKTWIGTSGFQYPEWKGKFYPENMSTAKMLTYYASIFGTTEVNYTFRSIPSEKTIQRWCDETPDNFRFAVQAGATHVVAHLTNYFAGRDPKIHGGDPRQGWGDCSTDTLWTYEELSALVSALKAEGLELAALENFSPRFWYDVLLDGPERPAQIEGLKRLIRDAYWAKAQPASA